METQQKAEEVISRYYLIFNGSQEYDLSFESKNPTSYDLENFTKFKQELYQNVSIFVSIMLHILYNAMLSTP